MRKILIVANWKMNPTTRKEAEELLRTVEGGTPGRKNIEVVVCPPFVYISNIKRKVSTVELGAQDCFYEQSGAYTGAVSPEMLKDVGCEYVIIGHSERKQYFGETDEIINKKVRAALKVGLKVILCVGEKARDSFDAGGRWTHELDLTLKDQVLRALQDVKGSQVENITIAYEPVWAIGTGKAATPDDVLSAKIFIRKILSGLHGRKKADSVKVLYGGSTSRKNAAEFITQGQADGLLVGGASLNAEEFISMIKNVKEGAEQ